MSQILKQSEKGEKEHEHGCIQYINTQSAIFRQLYYEDGGERMEKGNCQGKKGTGSENERTV